MATTKIWDIKGRLDSLINYAANPEKTDGKRYSETQIQALHDVMEYASDDYKTEKRLYVSGINATPDTAKYKMQQTKLRYGKTDGIVAFHAIQSFKPGEITPELAHEIGKMLAKEMWGDRFEVVVATHLNKDHLHNHFVINSVSFVDGKKYYDNTANYNRMKKISDRLCEEHNLSVIRSPEGKSKHYAEWLAEKKGYPTIRGQIRDELDEIIKCSYTMKEFWKILEERGFVICRRKPQYAYTSFIPPYGTKQVRLDKLGPDYTEEAIMERIRAARNGIRIDKTKQDYNAWLKKYEPIKLKGFKALYYHYLYLFGKIRKKETRQRVSYYLREELTKFERYQKQFHFLYENDIENSGQLNEIKQAMSFQLAPELRILKWVSFSVCSLWQIALSMMQPQYLKIFKEVIMKTLKAIVILILVSVFTTTTYAAEVPRESAPCNATEKAIITAEGLIGNILTEVQNGLGYADARAKTNRIIFDAFLNGQTNGFSYGELVDIANGAIFHYRNAYLRPNFYAENVERIRSIIAPVIDDYKNGKITYTEAEFNARVKIYQSFNPSFNPDVEFAKDSIYRDIPSVDNSLFAIARRLILEIK